MAYWRISKTGMKKNQSKCICKIYNIYNWTNTYDAACRPFCKYAFFQWCGKWCGILAILYLYLVCVACCFQHLSANAAMLPSLHCGPAIHQPLLKQLQRETRCNIAPYKHALNSCGTCLGISMMLPGTPFCRVFSPDFPNTSGCFYWSKFAPPPRHKVMNCWEFHDAKMFARLFNHLLTLSWLHSCRIVPLPRNSHLHSQAL